MHNVSRALLAVVALCALATVGVVTTAARDGTGQSVTSGASIPPSDTIPVFVTFRADFDRDGDLRDAGEEARLESNFVREHGAEVRHSYQLVDAVAVNIRPDQYGELTADSRIERVELDQPVQATDAELDASWGVKRIGAGSAHDAGITGAGVKVAMLDSGINTSHFDLRGNYTPACSHDFVNSDNDPTDDNGHGTHTSGIVAAADNGSGVVGVAPGAKLCVYKVLSAGGGGSWGDVVAALDRAVTDGAKVANLSLGAPGYPGDTVAQAFTNAYNAGLVIVAAAGNSGDCTGSTDSVLYPARFPEVIAVGAVDANDTAPCFSSAGPDVELAAPGTDIYSDWMGGTNAYRYSSGTSMAAPHVTGLAALILGCKPALANAEVRSIMNATARDLDSPLKSGVADGRDTLYGFGLVQVQPALVAAGCSPGATATPTRTATALPSATPSPMASPTPTPRPTEQPTLVASPTAPAMGTETPEGAATPSPTPSVSPPPAAGPTPCFVGPDLDTDCDGLPDRYEDVHGCLNSLSSSATQDVDQDALSNLAEFQLGTDPCNADTDGDGLLDGTEVRGVSDELGTFVTDPRLADTDGDGCSDGREVGADQRLGGRRDPTNPWDYFDLTHDHRIRIDEVVTVIRQYHIDRYLPSPPNPPDTLNPNYRADADRGYVGPNRWNLGPGDGRGRINDIAAIVQQFRHDCA